MFGDSSMPKFIVYGTGTYSLPAVQIEASSQDEAEDIYWDNHADSPILCHHCAQDVEIHDVTQVIVEE